MLLGGHEVIAVVRIRARSSGVGDELPKRDKGMGSRLVPPQLCSGPRSTTLPTASSPNSNQMRGETPWIQSFSAKLHAEDPILPCA